MSRERFPSRVHPTAARRNGRHDPLPPNREDAAVSAPERREPPVQPVSADNPPPVPARMVNEYVYCPSRTVPSVRAARWSRSVCRTRSTISRGPTSLRGRSPCPAPRRCLCACRPAAPRSRLKPDRLDHRQTGRVHLPRGIPAASLKHVVQQAAPGQADRVFRGGIPAASLEHGRLCARRSRRRCWLSGSRCRAWPRRWPTTGAVTRPQIVPDPGETCSVG